MLPILLAAAVVISAPAQLRAVDVARPAPVVVSTRTPAVDDNEHIAKARKALEVGDFDMARREFVIAAALDRDAGRLPTEAVFGLANTLYSLSYTREAAIVMNRLAEEASEAGDKNTEAKALADAMWLNFESGQRVQGRADGARLRTLLKDSSLSASTKEYVKSRTR
ncbi:MAG: hypothetical protein IBJ03_09540 [Gemmatimonadaceae bacterium]|nr:hypothetical protein [Gemmatimonadaceae bacterium]